MMLDAGKDEIEPGRVTQGDLAVTHRNFT